MAARRQRWIGAFAGGVLLTVLCVTFVDRPAATFAHSFLGAAPFVVLTHIVDPILPLSAIGFLLLGGAMLLGWEPPRLARLTFCLCVASLLAIMVKDQLKYAFGRTWPETWTNNNPSWIRDGVAAFVPLHGGTGWSSFPSGHMTTITAPMAVLMGVVRPVWRPVLTIPILLVAIGLFGADYHFLGDMVAGVMVGSMCAAIATRTLLPAPAAGQALPSVSRSRPAAAPGPPAGGPCLRGSTVVPP